MSPACGVPAAIAEGIELLDIAEPQSRLLFDPGAQADLEGAVRRPHRTDRTAARRACRRSLADAVRISGSLPSIATMAAVRPISIGVRSFSLIWRRLQRHQSRSMRNGRPSTIMLPGSHFVERAQHAPLAPQRLVGEADDQPVRLGDRGGGANLPRDRDLVAMRIERADRGKGARGRAADAGIAMHHQRRAAVPAAHEVQDLLDMGIRRRDKAVDLFGDVVHLHFQMIGGEHRFRPLHLIDIGHHGEDVAGAGRP